MTLIVTGSTSISGNTVFNAGAPAPSPAPGACDPYFNNVTLLLHMDGNSISSASGSRPFYQLDNDPTTTAEKKFGSGSADFYGDVDRGLVADTNFVASDEFNFYNNDFTIEAWINTSSVSSDGLIAAHALIEADASAGGNKFQYKLSRVGSGLKFSVFSGGNEYSVTGGSLSLNTWHHIAFVRSGTSLTGFLDGVQFDSITGPSTLYVPTVTGQFGGIFFFIGGGYNVYDMYYFYDFNGFSGYIDEVRVTKDVARYTSNFTVPTSEFPNIAC